MKKFNLMIYAVGVTLGYLAGACFKKAAYYKGKVDAYDEMTKWNEEKLNELKEEHPEWFEEAKETEE